jgi:putative oxidoreductase
MNLLKCKCAEQWSEVAPLALRLAVGAVFMVHGYQKFFEMGLAGVGGFFGSLGVPAAAFFAVVVSTVELVGGLMLVVGLFTHWAGKLLAINMLVAFALVHVHNGFYVNKGGFEFVLVLFAASIALSIMGAGKWSLDAKVLK